LILRAKGTPFFPMALALGMPAILYPFNFLFIFGGFEGDLPAVIVIIGMQKMLENSLDAYEDRAKVSAPEVIQPPKPRASRRFTPAGGIA
jgi:hypothetical protein